jgi:hypothetical protein
MKKESTFDDISLTPEMKLQYSSDEDEEEEEEEIEEEEEEKIDRETAIEKYKSLQTEGRPIFKKNIMLLKKLAEHFKKHKVNKPFIKYLSISIITRVITGICCRIMNISHMHNTVLRLRVCNAQNTFLSSIFLQAVNETTILFLFTLKWISSCTDFHSYTFTSYV